MTDLQVKAATLAETERANREKEAIERSKINVSDRLAKLSEAQEAREKKTYGIRFITEMLKDGFGMYKDTSTGAANLGKLVESLAGSIH